MKRRIHSTKRHKLAATLLLTGLSPCSTLISRPLLRSLPRPVISLATRIQQKRSSSSAVRAHNNLSSVIWESYPPINATTEVGSIHGKSNNRTDSEDEDYAEPDNDRFGIQAAKQNVASFLNEPLVEVLDCVLVLASSLFVAISTVDSLPSAIVPLLTLAQDFVAGVFVFEFFARWFCSSAPRGLHFTQPLILVDVFVVLIPFLVTTTGTEWLPAWLTSTSSLINLRLLRVLRLQRVLQNMKTFTRFERALGIPAGNVKAWQLQLARVVLSVFTLLSVATGLIYTVEHTVNPQIDNYFTALYFGLTTLTTVGFGDITPVTWQGKLVVSLSIMAGVTVIPAQGAALIDALLERQQEKELREAKASINATGRSTSRSSNNSNSRQILSAISKRRRSMTSATTITATDDLISPRMTLEMVASCSTCGANMHWSAAQYCWQCGRELILDQASEELLLESNQELADDETVLRHDGSAPVP
jgi:voltage-gated potassium channel